VCGVELHLLLYPIARHSPHPSARINTYTRSQRCTYIHIHTRLLSQVGNLHCKYSRDPLLCIACSSAPLRLWVGVRGRSSSSSSSHSLRAESQSQTFRPHTPLLLADCCQLFSLSLFIYIRSCTNKCTVSCCCWPFAPLMQSYGLETLSGLRESREMRSLARWAKLLSLLRELPAPSACLFADTWHVFFFIGIKGNKFCRKKFAHK
jgi:hypothetical protein